jgi:hypothetical protein
MPADETITTTTIGKTNLTAVDEDVVAAVMATSVVDEAGAMAAVEEAEGVAAADIIIGHWTTLTGTRVTARHRVITQLLLTRIFHRCRNSIRRLSNWFNSNSSSMNNTSNLCKPRAVMGIASKVAEVESCSTFDLLLY